MEVKSLITRKLSCRQFNKRVPPEEGLVDDSSKRNQEEFNPLFRLDREETHGHTLYLISVN